MNPLLVYGSGAVATALAAPVIGMFLPSVYEVRNGVVKRDPAEVRLALTMGGAVAVGVGVAAAMATRSTAPLVGALLGVAIVAGFYEWALRNPAGGE